MWSIHPTHTHTHTFHSSLNGWMRRIVYHIIVFQEFLFTSDQFSTEHSTSWPALSYASLSAWDPVDLYNPHNAWTTNAGHPLCRILHGLYVCWTSLTLFVNLKSGWERCRQCGVLYTGAVVLLGATRTVDRMGSHRTLLPHTVFTLVSSYKVWTGLYSEIETLGYL